MFKIGDKVQYVGSKSNTFSEDGMQDLIGKVGTIVGQATVWDWRVEYDEPIDAETNLYYTCFDEDELELVESA